MSDRKTTPKWWMTTADGERLCWVPGLTAEIAREVFAMCRPAEAAKVRDVVRVVEPDDFLEQPR